MSSNHQHAHPICTPATGTAKYVLPIAGLVTFIMAWSMFTDAKIVNPNFLPGPGPTAVAYIEMFHDAPARIPDAVTGQLRPINPAWGWESFKYSSGVQGTMASVSRIASAVLRACLIGIPLGILMGAFGTIEAFFAFLIPPMRNAPITAFLPLFMLVWGISEALKVNFLTLGTLVYIIPTTFDAVRNVDPAIKDRAVDAGFRRLSALFYFVIPAAAPRIFEGVGICAGIAVTYIVAAETVNVTNGLGAIIAGACRVQNGPRIYAGIIQVIILGVVTIYGFKLCQKHHLLSPEGE